MYVTTVSSRRHMDGQLRLEAARGPAVTDLVLLGGSIHVAGVALYGSNIIQLN